MSRFITEIDGANTAYIDFDNGSVVARFTFKIVSWVGRTEEEVTKKLEQVLAKVRGLLPDGGLIIWRQRPIVENVPRENKWGVYMRFATSPPLPAEFWEAEGKLEGAEPRELAA